MADLHRTTHLQAAAWVPDDDEERPWEDAVALAADWIWDRSEVEGVAPLLVTNTFDGAYGFSDLTRIAQAVGHATPRGRQRFDRGPVLVYVPDEATFAFALRLAHSHSLVVVESFSFPLAEWAASADAVNLITGNVDASSLPQDVSADLERAVSFGGNNGWTGKHERDHALRCLARHVQAGHLSPDRAASYVMARGAAIRVRSGCGCCWRGADETSMKPREGASRSTG